MGPDAKSRLRSVVDTFSRTARSVLPLTERFADTPDDASNSLRLAIAAIVRNEGPYLLEWIAFHRALGIDRFFIADNESDDGTSELLAALQSAGIVDHLPFPNVDGRAPQLPAYRKIIRRHGRDADWIAFIDADEFLMPTDNALTIRPFFERLAADVGAVAFNWAIYGSSFHRFASKGMVIERFTRRAKQTRRENTHIKTAIRPIAFAAPGDNPHYFRIASGFSYIHADGTPLSPDPLFGRGLTKEVRWSPVRINHYVIKSRAEFDRKKMPRGRATTLFNKRDSDFFSGHDRNEVSEPPPPLLVEATRLEIERLRLILDESGRGEVLARLDGAITKLVPLDDPQDMKGRGRINDVRTRKGMLLLRGWALSGNYKRFASFSLYIGEQKIDGLAMRRVPRIRIPQTYPGADEESGFLLSVPLSALPAELGPASAVKIVASGVHTFSFGLPKDVAWPPVEGRRPPERQIREVNVVEKSGSDS